MRQGALFVIIHRYLEHLFLRFSPKKTSKDAEEHVVELTYKLAAPDEEDAVAGNTFPMVFLSPPREFPGWMAPDDGWGWKNKK